MRTHWTDTAAPTRSLKRLSGRVSSRLGHFYKGYLVFLFSSRHWTGIIKHLNIMCCEYFCLIVLEVLHIFLFDTSLASFQCRINACLFVCLCVSLSVYLSFCLLFYLSLLYCLSLFLSNAVLQTVFVLVIEFFRF